MDSRENQDIFLARVTAGTIRVLLLGGWIAWCAQIVLPFLVPILWGAIIATAVYPLVQRLAPKRTTLGAVSFGVAALGVILVPAYLFFDSVGSFVVRIGRQWAQGQLKLPAPRADVANWPIIGRRVYSVWTAAMTAPAPVVETYLPQLRAAGRWLAQSLGSLTLGLLQCVFAIAVAVAFLAKAEASQRALTPIVRRIAPVHGQHLLELASATVRAVAKGVLGVAAIQAVLAWFGLALAGVPAPAAWALLVLILAVAQLPTLIVLGPIAVYLFASSTTTVAVPFLGWTIFVGVIDNVLKPLLLGRGARVPMLVIVIGAIGGMIGSGIIGLFVGAVVLSVGYQLCAAWVAGDEARRSQLPPPPVSESSPSP